MKYILPVFLASVIIITFFCPGCSPTSSDNGTAMLRGIVVDTSLPNQPKIVGATVSLDELQLTTTTNESGEFTFRDIAGGVYTLTVTCVGYSKYSEKVEVQSDDSTKYITVPLIFKKIYFYNDFVIDINSAGKFTYPAAVIPNNSLDKDVQVVDTISGPDTLLYLRSADLDILNPGFQTWFSDRKYSDMTQYQFDTLSQYVTEDGLMLPETRDFPFHNGLDRYLNYNSFQKGVWFFYLRGRGTGSRAVYGAMYLDTLWMEGNIRKMRVDLKINADAKYIFSLSLKK
jgi:hypothetical protein